MENLASGLDAIVMIGLAIYIAFRSYNQLINPHPIETPVIGAILALLATIIALTLGFYKYFKEKVRIMNINNLQSGQ